MRVSGNLLGVVLCGGESRRMGRDKGLIKGTGNRPWASIMADKIAGQSLPVVYSIHERQLDAYSAVIPWELLIVDSRHGDGPLDGLYSVHRRFPERDLLLVACDMPDLDAGTIRGLIDAYRERPAEFFAYEEDGRFQPFCAIYTQPGLARLLTRGGSLQGLLKAGPTHRLLVTDSRSFRNYNSL